MTAPSLTQYQIGWICALPVEITAAKQVLDEDFGMLESQDISDQNVYHLGRIGRHYIVIATLPAGQYGVAAATTVAVNMMRTFSASLRVGLMVGIGGGIPSGDHDIRLGDIVVSQPQGTCGGVWQYDTGKVISGGAFERTGSLNSPPRCLLAAVASMRAEALGDDPKYPEYVEIATKRNARMQKNFGRPDPSTDRLFRACHGHPETAATCKDCPEEWEERRDARDEMEPQVFYGIIASGNSVIKHASTRDALRTESGALCFEMEAAGLMLDFPCIVIRGICDYADSHKNKQWQGYAALAAAAYAKELLSHLPAGRVSQETLAKELCKNIVEEIQLVNRSIERAFDQRENHHRERIQFETTKEQQECHQALKTSTYEQHKNINPEPVKGTCRWLLDNPQYLSWVGSAQNDLLWISADPGCGKSVLAKSLIDSELNNISTLVCYFFFKDNNDQNNLATALCAVLHQLFAAQPQLLSHAIPSWQKIRGNIQNEVEELWRILLACTLDPAFNNTVCILDALDECRSTDRASLIKKLELFYDVGLASVKGQKKADSASHWLKFLVTSRPYGEIKHEFRPSTDKFPYIHVCGEDKNEQISEEINLVIKTRVAKLSSKHNLAPDMTNRVEKQLLTMQHRTYLWLHLALDDLDVMFHNSLRTNDVLVELIPTSVRAAYTKILERVPPDQQSLVKTILRVIVGARRALTIKEMARALGLALDFAKSADTPLTKESFLSPTGLDSKIRHLCGLFIFINGSRIYLIHQTAREFLLGDGHEWFLDRGGNEAILAHVCISSLLLYDFHEFNLFLLYMRHEDCDDAESSSDRYRSKNDDFILVPYCLDYWADHVHELPRYAETKLESKIGRLYDTRSSYCTVWYQKRRDGRILEDTTGQHCLAAYNGHYNVVRRMVKELRQGIDDPVSCATTALYWASYGGCVKSANILLDYGANINCMVSARECQTPIHISPTNGQAEIAKLPLGKIFDINAEAGHYGTALHAASVRGNIEIIQLLLNSGADIDAKSGEYGTALQAASLHGNIEIIQLLLNKGADIDAKAGQHGTALQAALTSGNIEIIQLLLNRGADIDAEAGLYGTALQAASVRGNIEIKQLLLNKGANITAKAGLYSTALQAASVRGDIEIIQLLLNRGANINAEAGRYNTALQAASVRGDIEIIQLLLNKGANINAEAGRYGTALQAASVRGDIEIIQLLLNRGANINAEAGLYGTALQAASLRGNIEIIQLLLDRGANINAEAGRYGTALQAASLRGNIEIIQLLLDRGANINATAGEYGTALQAASIYNHIEIVQLLLDRGADVNIEAGEYNTALQAASARGNLEIVQLLLDRRARVNAEVVQAASVQGSTEMMQLLQRRGSYRTKRKRS